MGAAFSVPAMSPLACDPPRVDGVPIGAFVRGALRRMRAGRPAALPGTQPLAPAAAEPAPLPTLSVVLPATLRGHSLAELAVEAARLARNAAVHREEMEGLAFGRTYGDPELRAARDAEPDACLMRLYGEAVAQADRAGAIADFLRALCGHEAEIETILAGGIHG